MAPEAAVPDPYVERTSFWIQHSKLVWAFVVFLLTAFLTVACFPPFTGAEFGYAFAVPAIFWAYLRPSFRLFATTLLLAQGVAWAILLGWLYHVTWFGPLLLGPFVGAWVGLWFLAMWWTIPRMQGRATGVRILAMFGLAALWVFIEWTRTWLLSGFPWLPLAASQWQRSIVLQIASFTGAGGVSFILISFNIGFAAYAHRLFREKQQGLRRRSPEFMAALMTLMFPTFLLIADPFHQDRQYLATIAVVQPDIPQALKWDPSQSDMIFNTLGNLTARAAVTRPDLILWPEASTPFAVKGDDRIKGWTESLMQKCQVPLLLGSLGIENPGTSRESWVNGAFVVDPVAGLQSSSYAKRHLVPFGEYVPLRPMLGWIGKFVPMVEDTTQGNNSAPLIVTTKSAVLAVGTLICYEDIFPDLSRSEAMAGADLLAVLTNDAWFGTGGAAYQHAAHSVLRAVETRRPVVRCGNNGWTGWIDEYGKVRQVMQSKKAGQKPTVYFRGTTTFSVTRDSRWIGRQSFYSEHGDWFILLCLGIVVLSALTLVVGHAAPLAPRDGDISADAPF